MYFMEFAASGGVPNWMENPAAVDPLERSEKELNESSLPRGSEEDGDSDASDSGEEGDVVRSPVTVAGIGGIKKEPATA